MTESMNENNEPTAMSDAMSVSMVPPPLPPPPLPRRDSLATLRVALPLLTLSWLVLAIVIVASLVPVQRWELAPGEAAEVSPLISFAGTTENDAPERFTVDEGIRFVTAFGGQMSALDASIAAFDPWVEVETYEEHFGDLTPSERQRLGYQSMVGAKQIAEYLAARTLGLPAEMKEGKVIVEELLCEGELPDVGAACDILDVGDTIAAFAGSPTPTLTALSKAMEGSKVGDSIEMTVVPHGEDDETKTVARTVTLMEDPDTPGRAIIGIVPADTRTVDLPFEVTIATADIGGPSAGLAFTIALLDELTKGDLTGKGRVAATGTIEEDGTVGAIGALAQKAIAVRDAGATLFLVPSSQSDDEIADARRAAGSGVTIVPVGSLDEALAALRENGGDPLPAT